jgi:MFS family permease
MKSRAKWRPDKGKNGQKMTRSSLIQRVGDQVPGFKQPLFFGWYVLGATFFIDLVVTGTRSSFGIFVLPMSEEFGWSRLTISLVAALGAIVGGVTQPFIGNIFDRFSGRTVILLGLVVVGLSIIALSFTFHILFLMFMFGIVFATASGGARVSRGALLARWFIRKRATVVSIAAAGSSLGSLLLVPLGMYLLQASHWRVSWAALGLVILLVAVPLAWLFIRDDPSKLGLRPYGEPEPTLPEKGDGSTAGPLAMMSGPLEATRWAESFRSWPIWQVSGSYFVCGFTTLIISVHYVPYAIERDVSPGTAATIFGLMMGLNIVGGLGAGMLADRFGRKNVLAAVYFMRGCGYLVLLSVPSALGLWLFAAVVGFSWVATASLSSTLTADVYGLKALGTITGVSFLFHQVGGLAGVLLGGFLYDLTGSYTLPFAIVGATLFPAALSAFTIKERTYSSRYQSAAVPAPALGV